MDTEHGTGAAVPARLVPFDALYDEALSLAEATRRYVAQSLHREPRDPLIELVATCETTRLIARLGCCLAWLLARRAVQSGEIPAEEAAQARWRLDGHGLSGLAASLAGLAASPAALPPPLADLLARSASLHERIERLDGQLGNRPP